MDAPERDVEAKGAARSAVLLGISVIVLVSPIRLLWAREGAPWYTSFAIWLALVALAAIAVSAVGRPGQRG